MKSTLWGWASLADTRAYFPSREEAERFARQFDGERYRIDILPQPRPGREVYQVHVHRLDAAAPEGSAMPTDWTRILAASPDVARGCGEGEARARAVGKALGETMALKEAPPRPARREALDRLGTLLLQAHLGSLGIVSVTPLVLRVQTPPAHAVIARERRCGHVAGFMEGALGVLLGKGPQIREVDCVGLGNAHCTFICEL